MNPDPPTPRPPGKPAPWGPDKAAAGLPQSTEGRVRLVGEVVIPEFMRRHVDAQKYAMRRLETARAYLLRKAVNDGMTSQCLRTAAAFLGSVEVEEQDR